MQEFLTLNQTASNDINYIYASTMILFFVFCGIKSLIHVIAVNGVEMSYLLFEKVVDFDLFTKIQSIFLFNSLEDKFSQNMTPDLLEKLKNNLDKVHLFVFHGEDVRYILFTINPNFTINVHAEAFINEHTITANLRDIRTQFETAINLLLATKGSIILNIIILISNTDNLLITPTPFLPLMDFITWNSCSLFTHVLGSNDITYFYSNIFYNLNNLAHFITSIVIRCNFLYNFAIHTPDSDLAEYLWAACKSANQLIRYAELIQGIYGPVQPVNTEVSTIMEEISDVSW